MKIKTILLTLTLVIPIALSAKIKVVTTFSDYASIVKEIGGDLVDVEYLSHGDQDPHFVPPKPSLAIKLKKADLLVSTGLDLEMWVATLQDKARNKKVMDGAIGFVTTSPGIKLLQKPTTAVSRSEGDVHLYGNPHIHTSPVNWKVMSGNILIGLEKVDPNNAATYEANQKKFNDKVDRALFGDALVDMIGGDELCELLINGTLFDFLDNDLEGVKLIDELGGWLKKAEPFRNLKVMAYHKNWAYFVKHFGLNVIGYIEAKPGIPPTPKHVEETIELIKSQDIKLMLVASYFEQRKPKNIAMKTGITALPLPLSVDGVPEATDNFKLIDYWIDQINNAIQDN